MNHLSSTVALSALLAAPIFAQDDDRESLDVTGWWVKTAQTVSDIQSMASQGYRPIDVEVQTTSPASYAMTYVRNTGSYQRSWTMLTGKTSAEIAAAITSTNRLANLDPYVVNGQVRFNAIFNGNTGAQQKGWYWWHGQTLAYIHGRCTTLGARLVDIDSYVVGNTRYYSGIAIKNTGSDARSWWVYENLTTAEVAAKTSLHNARVYDIEYRSLGRHDVVLVRPTVMTSSWWYVGKTMSELDDLSKQNGARIFDIERYVVNNTAYYLALMIQNTNELTTKIGRDLREETDGVRGFILKRINGSTLAALQRDFQFDPASTIKQLHGAFAYRRALVDANITPTSKLAYRDGPCPYTTGNLQTLELQEVVRRVLENSDNRLTDAIERNFGGKAALHAFADSLGMTSTRSNRIMGCTAPPFNTMTLDDLTRLHTEITNGLLGGHRDSFIARMLNATSTFPGTGLNYLDNVLSVERIKAGLSAAEYAPFQSSFRLGFKPGAKTINGKFHRTTSGWVQIPFIVNNKVELREYAFGAFAHAATDDTKASNAVSKAVHELLRDRIAAAMATWKGFQFGTFVRFGSSCKSGTLTPRHDGSGNPEVGQTANFVLTDAPAYRPVIMWVGASRDYWNRSPLPIDLGVLGAPGCRLYVAPHIALPGTTNRVGSLTIPVPLNVSKNLIGSTFYTQFAIGDRGQNAAGFVTTNGLATTLGGTK